MILRGRGTSPSVHSLMTCTGLVRLVKVSFKTMDCRGNCPVCSPAKEATLGSDVAVITSAFSSSSL